MPEAWNWSQIIWNDFCDHIFRRYSHYTFMVCGREDNGHWTYGLCDTFAWTKPKVNCQYGSRHILLRKHILVLFVLIVYGRFTSNGLSHSRKVRNMRNIVFQSFVVNYESVLWTVCGPQQEIYTYLNDYDFIQQINTRWCINFDERTLQCPNLTYIRRIILWISYYWHKLGLNSVSKHNKLNSSFSSIRSI